MDLFSFERPVQLEWKAAFHQLHGSFQCYSRRREDEVEVIRHDHKFMQKKFLFDPVREDDFDKQPGNLFHLEQTSLFQHIGGDKVSGLRCSSAMWNSQKVTSAAKAAGIVAALPQG
jgi:hypothetical protein